jgi:hypothetical protein
MAFRTGGPQHLYRFTLDDQQGGANVWKIRPCRSPKRELYEIALHLDVDVKELLVSSK